MSSPSLTQYSIGTRWCASQSAVNAEIERLKSIKFFELESFSVEEKLEVIGTIGRKRKCGTWQRMRLRIAYPHNFPANPPIVFDSDKRFEPVGGSHQFLDYQLCLEFPHRHSFSKLEDVVSAEVLGASLNWMVKRELFDKNPALGWPEEAEPHHKGLAFAKLAWDLASESGIGLLKVWVVSAVELNAEPRFDRRCPCGGTKLLKDCHSRIGNYIGAAIIELRGENQ
jgi:hypothetical protein